MADPLATVGDLVARWRSLSSAEEDVAEVLIADASAQVRAEVSDVDARVEAGTLDPILLTRVVTGMVKRAMIAGDTGLGVSGTQETTGPFSQSFNYANPMGDLYLTKAERRLLGGGRTAAFMVDTLPPGAGSVYPGAWTEWL